MMTHITKKTVLLWQLLIILVFSQFTFGQIDSNKYDLKTKHGTYKVNAFKASDFKQLKGPEFDSKHFRLVQFYQIPTNEQRQSWEKQGMLLIDYLSANTYYVSINKSFPINELKDVVRSIMPVDTQSKKEGNLYYKDASETAKNSNIKEEYVISYYKGLNYNDVRSDLQAKGVQIVEHRAYSYQIDVIFVESELETITSLPYVQFIGVKQRDFVNESLDYRNTSSRVNYLNSDYNGLNYNGAGVVIGLGEDEIVGDHIDFKGRVAEAGTSDSSGSNDHKIIGLQNMGGAGNLDPSNRNNAWGATLLSLRINTDYVGLYSSHDLRYTNHSIGTYVVQGGYDSRARAHDLRIESLPNHMVSYSSGNSGSSTGISPYPFPNWANISGAFKESKNQITVGAISPEDVIESFSSRGPMYDGRIIPQLVDEGADGTSFSSPKVTGQFAVLAQAYKDKNGGTEPESSLLRAVVMNTADDLGNPGPDYIYGYGRPNLRRAYNILDKNQYMTSTVAHGATNNHSITIPDNVKQVRVMVVWPDVAASVNADVALINNLNLSLTAPSSTSYNPWVLDSSPSVASISAPATRGVDNLNTIEQVTLDNPVAGSWTINVNGNNVPLGPQKYFVVYEYLYEELQIAFPLENQKFTSGKTYYIRWDSYGSSDTFNLSYELNNSGTWIEIESGYDATKRVYKWLAPDVSHGINTIKFKVERNALSSISGVNQIGDIPENFRIIKVCDDVVSLKWSELPGATAYKVYRLGAEYMEEVTANISFSGSSAVLTGQSVSDNEYYAVSAITGTAEGQRTLAIQKTAGYMSCNTLTWTGATSSDWFDQTNWSSATIPTSDDDVVISSSAPNQPEITADGAICGAITIDSGASLAMDATTGYTLSVSKDWTNNGTFTSGIGTVDFISTTSYQEITGTSTTNFYILKVTKGSQDIILEVNALITLDAASNPLVLTSGTFKLSSDSTITPFTSAIALTSTRGFWNNGGTVSTGNFTWALNSGLLKISGGTTNIGTGSNNRINYLNNGTLIIEGGILNVAGRISPNSNNSSVIYTQTGGVVTVNNVGNTSNSRAPFEMGVNASFTCNGGTIIIKKPSPNYADYVNVSNSSAVSGGVLQLGNNTTDAGKTFRIDSKAPIYNLNVNDFNEPVVQLVNNDLIVSNDLTISGGTLDTNGKDITIEGDWTNNGMFLPNAGTVSFTGTSNQLITGSTTFYNLELDNSLGLSLENAIDITNNCLITVGRMDLGSALTHAANTLTLAESGVVSGSWGSSASLASHTDDTYFSGTGIMNVNSCGTFASWVGNVDTSWNNSANWSVCGVPTFSSNVEINPGTFQPEMTSDVIINSLKISSGATLTTNSGFNLTVQDAIVNNGELILKTHANLIQNGTSNTNSGSGVTKVESESTPLFQQDHTLWSSPVSGTFSLGDFSPLTAPNQFQEYDTNSDLYAEVSNSTVFVTGKSYLIGMPNNWVSYPGTAAPWTGTFEGTPNNGNITYTLSVNGNAYNAVGNPYPSALSIDSFITDNINNITGTLYFWRKTSEDSNSVSYATSTTAGSTLLNGDVVSVGQGFIVKAKSSALNFTNAMRTSDNTTNSTGIEKHRIWLNLSSGPTTINQMLIAYMTGATEGLDPGIDGAYFNDNDTALNSLVVDEEFAIQGRSLPFEGADIVPLAFKTDVSGQYTISLDHVDGLFAGGQNIYLVDSNTGNETNLKTNDYTFNATIGSDNDRFTLRYQKTLSVNTADFNESNITVYQNNETTYVNSSMAAISTIKVFDLLGRLVVEQNHVNSNTATINLNNVPNQVLVVQIKTEDNKIINKKMVNLGSNQ
ncbi:S8 family serine peptidase [Tamlana haliotis]|uniref:S8 family serine peptidase n=1 Tax=Pseudotamlana haliotis TaxID=2614804 RepID=A0A6N6MEJ0_9FLAO|nr:S8 family serine peptidase [Tamlana haliotis]KAB1067738.1 S8 family serine peptidase [Tamlana haliotis]